MGKPRGSMQREPGLAGGEQAHSEASEQGGRARHQEKPEAVRLDLLGSAAMNTAWYQLPRSTKHLWKLAAARGRHREARKAQREADRARGLRCWQKNGGNEDSKLDVGAVTWGGLMDRKVRARRSRSRCPGVSE